MKVLLRYSPADMFEKFIFAAHLRRNCSGRTFWDTIHSSLALPYQQRQTVNLVTVLVKTKLTVSDSTSTNWTELLNMLLSSSY